MNTNIQYILSFPDGTEKQFEVSFETSEWKPEEPVVGPLPAWTELDYHKCPHCPLQAAQVPRCPLATSLARLVKATANFYSFDEAKVKIISHNRTIYFDTSVQKALSSLMGLVIPTSGCPHTAYFKPMARFHLPLSDMDETIFRAASMYLLSQYYRKQLGQDAAFDVSGLKKIYENIHVVNTHVSKRLRSEGCKDASVNAVTILDMFSLAFPYYIDQSLDEFRYLFNAYFDDGPISV